MREIFVEALEKSTSQGRAAYLDRACRGDAPLRSRIEILLKNHREDNFLEKPAVDVEKAGILPDRIPSESAGDIKTAPILPSPTAALNIGGRRKPARSNP